MKKICFSIVIMAIVGCSQVIASNVQSSGDYLREQLDESIQSYEDAKYELEKAKTIFWQLDILKTPKGKNFAVMTNLFNQLVDEAVQAQNRNDTTVMTPQDEIRLRKLNNRALRLCDEIYTDLGMKSSLAIKKEIATKN